ncbi:MAG: chemotaxis protein CheA, partial [Polyangiales bacterium]
MTDDVDLFGLFLALGEARVGEARSTLSQGELDRDRLAGAMIPLAVDAALLGAEGVSRLARAIANPGAVSREDLGHALDSLAAAVVSLGQGDASGARADEASLVAVAEKLAAREEVVAPAPATVEHAPQKGDDAHWIPSLPEELVGTFLDECHERIEGLSARLLEIEQEGAHAAGGEGIRALFRDLHTLKGSSGFAGLWRLNRLAHAAEDLVAKVRDGVAPCDRPTIDVLLASVDRFRAIVERASTRAPIDVEVDDVIARLKDPRSAAAAPAKVVVTEAAPKAVAASAGTLRVEFERVDQLQNFVNELVLARSRLTRATGAQLGLGRELARLRRRMGEMALGDEHDSGRTKEVTSIAEELGRAERVIDEGGLELEASLGSLGGALAQLRDRVMRLRMVPIARLFSKHQRTVRELGGTLGKKVRLDLRGQETELDKVLVEQLEDPLIHLVRNAVDHGIETPDVRLSRGKPEVGTLTLSARQQGGAIVVEIVDDGGGIDAQVIKRKGVEKGLVTAEEAETMTEREALDLIFRAGFSTAAAVTDVSGRGVGMDVVRESIQRLKGTIEIHSKPGEGTTFELRLPLTLAVAQVLLVRAAGEEVAIPIDAVARTLSASVETVEDVGGRPCLVERLEDGERRIPVIDLAETLGLEGHGRGTDLRAVGGTDRAGGQLVVLEAPLTGVDAVALECDALMGRHDVVVKPLGPMLVAAPCVAGATLLGDKVVLLLDLGAIVRRGLDAEPPKRRPKPAARAKRGKILIAEDADVVREALR